nr:MAG TPA: hypothetical protein [Caudoviricetes sp.]
MHRKERQSKLTLLHHKCKYLVNLFYPNRFVYQVKGELPVHSWEVLLFCKIADFLI